MASIHFIDMKNGNIYVNLKLSRGEYRALGQETENLVVLPTSKKLLDTEFTTGKLGNSNRIMLPKRLLNRENIRSLSKKVSGNLFSINGSVFMLVNLKESRVGVPRFTEVKNEEDKDGHKGSG